MSNDFSKLLLNRRSCRLFSGEEIDAGDVQTLLRAALLAPSSRNRQSWHFYVTDSRDDLIRLADAKEQGARLIAGAALAVAIAADPQENDCWVEDGAIAAMAMLCQAEELQLGACYVQIRQRYLSDGTHAEDVVKGILDIPDNMGVLCILAFGHPDKPAKPHREEDLKWEQIHVR